jgi:hypothetical protein
LPLEVRGVLGAAARLRTLPDRLGVTMSSRRSVAAEIITAFRLVRVATQFVHAQVSPTVP